MRELIALILINANTDLCCNFKNASRELYSGFLSTQNSENGAVFKILYKSI